MPEADLPTVGRDRESGDLDRGGQKGGLTETLAAEISQGIDQLIGDHAADSLDLEGIETAARRQALRLAAALLERHINADHSDYAELHRPCRCGHSA